MVGLLELVNQWGPTILYIAASVELLAFAVGGVVYLWTRWKRARPGPDRLGHLDHLLPPIPIPAYLTPSNLRWYAIGFLVGLAHWIVFTVVDLVVGALNLRSPTVFLSGLWLIAFAISQVGFGVAIYSFSRVRPLFMRASRLKGQRDAEERYS